VIVVILIFFVGVFVKFYFTFGKIRIMILLLCDTISLNVIGNDIKNSMTKLYLRYSHFYYFRSRLLTMAFSFSFFFLPSYVPT
jgi:hypothetical protein